MNEQINYYKWQIYRKSVYIPCSWKKKSLDILSFTSLNTGIGMISQALVHSSLFCQFSRKIILNWILVSPKCIVQKNQMQLWHKRSRDSYPTSQGGIPHVSMSSPRKQRLRSSPSHNWTPTMPKMKKTKKQRSRTFPSIGRVSNSSVTKILIPTQWDTNNKDVWLIAPDIHDRHNIKPIRASLLLLPWRALLILCFWSQQLHPRTRYNYNRWQYWKWQIDIVSSSGIWTRSFLVATII